VSSWLIKTIQQTLAPCWQRRLSLILMKAHRANTTGMSVEDAYLAAYRTAYWDAVEDLASGDLLRYPGTPLPAIRDRTVSDDVA